MTIIWKRKKKRKQENDIKKIEEAINDIENKKQLVEQAMIQPEIATNSLRLQELSSELNKLQLELDSFYEKWEQLI